MENSHVCISFLHICLLEGKRAQTPDQKNKQEGLLKQVQNQFPACFSSIRDPTVRRNPCPTAHGKQLCMYELSTYMLLLCLLEEPKPKIKQTNKADSDKSTQEFPACFSSSIRLAHCAPPSMSPFWIQQHMENRCLLDGSNPPIKQTKKQQDGLY